jgi:hypothetical protein
VNDFSGWVPMRIYWRDCRPVVDWGHLGGRRFTDPFFAQTINECVRLPADLLFRHQTPLEKLDEIASSQPGLRPTGFVFHMSRCGSTLISQMLAASPENVVLSEAGPIDAVLRMSFRDPAVTEAQRAQWLRRLVGILAWRRHPAEKNVFIKFDCWHTLFLPLIQRAFPGVPWIFAYREPIEVLASQAMQLGGQMIPGVLEPGLFGWNADDVGRMPINEHGARVLAKICEAALGQIRNGKGKLVNYRQLPTAIWPALMEFWQVKFSADETARMLGAARMNAKNPVLPFKPDCQAKRDSASPEIRALSRQWLDTVYQRLESERLARGFA